jgi:hypothetical protein
MRYGACREGGGDDRDGDQRRHLPAGTPHIAIDALSAEKVAPTGEETDRKLLGNQP